MAEQQGQRFFITPDLMQLQRQLGGQLRILRILFHLLLQLLDFRGVGGLFEQLNLRHQTLIVGILILQRNGFQHAFRFIGTVQSNQRFRQQQANLAFLIRQLPGFLQQRQGIGVFFFLHQGQRLLSFQLLFTGQDFIQQGADRFFRLRAFKTIHRLAVLEQINRRDGAQTKL